MTGYPFPQKCSCDLSCIYTGECCVDYNTPDEKTLTAFATTMETYYSVVETRTPRKITENIVIPVISYDVDDVTAGCLGRREVGNSK